MIDFTSIVRPIFMQRVKAAEKFVSYADVVQQAQLRRLLNMAGETEIGRKYDFKSINSYEQFASRLPIHCYEDFCGDIMRMVAGERDVLWRGCVRRYAQSSGTSDGRSKYIPISEESLKKCHYQGGFDVVAHYLNINPDSKMFSGKGFILGGSFASEVNHPDDVRVGDLSANLIANINPLVNLVRVPSKEIALLSDWEQKLPALVEASIDKNITNISGVPSWFLTVIKEVIKARGAKCIHEVWPNLEVFFHGGINFAPYRTLYESICDPAKMHYLETYNASEGFFAVQSSWDTKAMLLLLDIGVFYEFIPLDQLNSASPKALPIWEVEKGKTYALVITANNGLWRYLIGDTVKIESVAPVKITIAGRTKHFINAFGEELMVHNADDAIAKTVDETKIGILNYTAAPVYTSEASRGRHQWLIEFDKPIGESEKEQFASILDDNLRKVNSDYDAKRTKDIFLAPLEITIANKGLFDSWLALGGKLGGQRKIPRLSNDRQIIDKMIELNNNNNNK